MLGQGSDIFINAGTVDGDIDLGSGDDYFLIDIDVMKFANVQGLEGGTGFDAFGVYTREKKSGDIETRFGFESAAVFVDGTNSSYTITDVKRPETTKFLRLLGNGVVINEADISGSSDFTDRPTVDLITDDLVFQNNASVTGFEAIRLSGNRQRVDLNSDLVRTEADGARSSALGIVVDAGFGNTIVNNAKLSSTNLAGAAIHLGEDDDREIEATGNAAIDNLVTTLVNNGRLEAVDFDGGLTIATNQHVRVTNNGFIDKVTARRSLGGMTFVNQGGATVEAISVLDDVDFNNRPEASSLFAPIASVPTIIRNSGELGSVRFDDLDSRGLVPESALVSDIIINEGRITGLVDLDNGNDAFVKIGNDSFEASVNGGAGYDVLGLTGVTGRANLRAFKGFERLDVATDGVVILDQTAGLNDSFHQLVVHDGSVELSAGERLNAFVSSNAKLNVRTDQLASVTLAGTLELDGSDVQELSVTGDLTVGTAASINLPSGSPLDALEFERGLLTFDPATIELSFLGTEQGLFDRIDVGADLNISERLNLVFNFEQSFDFQVGDVFEFLSMGGETDFALDMFNVITNGLATELGLRLRSTPAGLTAEIVGTPVPVPGAIFLFLVGSMGFLVVTRRSLPPRTCRSKQIS